MTKSSGYGTRISYLKVDSLPPLGSDHFITGALLKLRSVNAGQTQEVVLQSKEPLADWTVSTVITSPPALSGECQDGWIISPSALDGWCEQDVTALARKWYLGQNYGAAFVPRDTGETIIKLVSANGTSGSKPYFSVTYKSLAGLEDYLSYDSQTVGRAGTGYVSLHNGNLVFCHSDTQMDGLRMPVSVTHIYNSCDADADEFGMGKGWRTNYHRTIHKAYLNSSVWYVYGDEDGTEHWFAPPSSGTEYKDEDGLGLTLAAGDTVTVTDKMNTVITFPQVTGTPTASSPVTAKVLMTSIKDACGNEANIEVTSGTLRIAKITDGVHGTNALGRETTFTYSGSPLRCARIQTPWQESTACTRFTYTSGKLTGVTYEDHTADVPKQSAYTYTDQGGYALLTGATGPEGLTAAYTYTTAGAVHAVTRATVTGGSLKGSDTDYIYGHLLTRAYDRLSGKTIRYHFNDAGNLISIDDEAGYARYTRYDDSANKNHVTDTSRLQRVVVNLLTDGLLNDNSALWVQGGTGTFARDSSVRMWGSVSQKITITAGQTAYKRQQVTLTPGESYTFSAWIKSGAPKAFLRVSYTQSGSTVNIDSAPVITGNSAFERIAVSFTMPSGVSAAYCSMMCTTTAGSAWFDGLQLEKGSTLNHFNLLQNSDFSKGTGTLPDSWSKLYAGSDYDFAVTWSLNQSGYTPPGILSGRAVKVTGLFYASTGAYQTFNLSGSAGDRFSAGGWYAGYARKNRANNEARCRIAVQFYSTASGWVTGGAIDWNSTEGQWQFASCEIAAPSDYTQVKYIIEYFRQINYAYFTGLYLYPEAFGVKYTYNAGGDPVSVRTLFDQAADTQYDAYHNVTSYTAPGDTVSTTYTYGTSAAQKKKHLPIKVTSPLGTVTKNSYNGHGGITQTDVKAEDTDTALFIRTQTDYTSGNYVSKRRDAREKEVTIVTDPNKGTVTSVTAPLHSTVTHEYDQMRRVLKSEASDGTNAHKTEYVYNAKDQLTQVKHNTTSDTSDVKYNFTYDALGRRLQVKVGTQMLSKNTYTNSGVHTGTLSKVEYGNGDSVSYVYDEFNRIRGVKYGTETTPRYEYDYNAKGQSAWVKDNQLSRVTQSEYDLADRPCRVTLRQNGSHMVTAEAAYDPVKGLLTKFTERIGTNYSRYETTYGYDSERRPATISYGSTSDQTKYTYDALGRITKRIVKVGGYSYESTMSYLAGEYDGNSTTGLVSQISQTGRTHVYTYNDAGSIATDRYGGKTTRYTYDKIGQLVRVDDPHDTAEGSTGTTWTYEYDRGGNLTAKGSRAHTTDESPGAANNTYALTYGASAWKDKMTAYGGTAITYDAMGNPLSDGTWTYTWTNGRQLQGMTKTGTSASFLYNEEGLRVRKTVGSAVTHYFWHGDKVTYMVRGSEVLYFWYDGQNRPAVVAYNGTKYAYVYSLQGDVLALINSSGTEVVGYNYNAWGETLSVTGTLAATLGNIQPFRYRGYIYDYETGLYYLRSRYYNPVWCRFINADSLVNGNLYCYCGNNVLNNEDQSGMLWESLINYLQITYKYQYKQLDNYSIGELRGTDVAFRRHPYVDSNERWEMDPDYVDSLYVKDRFLFEGNDVPGDAINRDPSRIWYAVILFPKEKFSPFRKPLVGYICAEYVYLPFGNNNNGMITTTNVNLRYTPSKDEYRKAVLPQDTNVTPLFSDESNRWYYCNTPNGLGWILKDFLSFSRD